MTIDFVTDYVCPYCLVAKEALEQVVDELKLQDLEIVYHPLELTPPEKEQVDTYHDAVRREHYKVLEEPAKLVGLEGMQLPPHIIPRPRTRLAWEAWLFACDHGRGSVWSTCMYLAYFMHVENIGDPEWLKRYARVLGMDPAELQKAWDEGRYTARLLEMEKEAREKFDPQGVPTIWCNGKRFKVEKYTREEMTQQLQWALGLGEENPEAQDGASCGPDGCN